MCKKTRGFTLTEALFALFLVTITALIMAAAMPIGHHSRQKADWHLRAAELAQRQLEEMRNVGYPNLSADALVSAGLLDSNHHYSRGYRFTNVHSAQGDAVSSVLPGGRGYVEITQTGLDTKSLVVQVRWTEDTGVKQVELATIVGNF